MNSLREESVYDIPTEPLSSPNFTLMEPSKEPGERRFRPDAEDPKGKATRQSSSDCLCLGGFPWVWAYRGSGSSKFRVSVISRMS